MNRNDDLIDAYLADALTDEEFGELQDWMRADVANLKKFVLATARDEQLRAVVTSSIGLADAKQAQTSEHDHSGLKKLLPSVPKWAIAASVIAFATWTVIPRSDKPSLRLVESSESISIRNSTGELSHLNAGEDFSTGRLLLKSQGAHAKFSYSDGSTLSLSGGSELELDDGNVRQLVLRNGALFGNVSHQSGKHPLVVRTSTAEATVLGTEFAIATDNSETLLQVRHGSVRVRRLSDDQALTVGVNQQVRAGPVAGPPMIVEPVMRLPTTWRATPTDDSGEWIGEWGGDGILRAMPTSVFIKEQKIEETHYQAGVWNRFPGFLSLREDSIVFLRYRVNSPKNFGFFLSTHAPSWEFAGNFQAYVIPVNSPSDEEGWRTVTLPITSFAPMGMKPLPFQPGCSAATFYVTTYGKDLQLEIAAFEVRSGSDNE